MALVPSPGGWICLGPVERGEECAGAGAETGGYAQLPRNRMVLGIQVEGRQPRQAPMRSTGFEYWNTRRKRQLLPGLLRLQPERFEGSYLKQADDFAGDLLHVVSRLD